MLQGCDDPEDRQVWFVSRSGRNTDGDDGNWSPASWRVQREGREATLGIPVSQLFGTPPPAKRSWWLPDWRGNPAGWRCLEVAEPYKEGSKWMGKKPRALSQMQKRPDTSCLPLPKAGVENLRTPRLCKGQKLTGEEKDLQTDPYGTIKVNWEE